VRTELITRRDDLVIRRLVLDPGEAMSWHTDSCHRFSVVVRGERLRIEFRDTGEAVAVAVHPGMADWDEPESRVHRAVNVGATPYEEIVSFFLPAPGADPQPER
jgi:quercetin dioxygenase-like cupin family protein